MIIKPTLQRVLKDNLDRDKNVHTHGPSRHLSSGLTHLPAACPPVYSLQSPSSGLSLALCTFTAQGGHNQDRKSRLNKQLGCLHLFQCLLDFLCHRRL